VHAAHFQISLDGGASFAHLEPLNGAYSPSHSYEYVVVGTGEPAAFRIVDQPTGDNYGVLTAITEPESSDGDFDDDGYRDTDEVAKGSNPFNAGSTPEVCDGADNDGDTEVDEEPSGADWDIDGDSVMDCLDSDVDTDGDGVVNTMDSDDDGDGYVDSREQFMATDQLGNCSIDPSHDAWGPDRDGDRDADVGDLIQLFLGKVLNPANYDARADADGDGDDDIGDLIILFASNILTECRQFTFTNSSGGPVNGIHTEWSAPLGAVFSASDSDSATWSDRTMGSGGLMLDLGRPAGGLENVGHVFVVVKGPKASVAWSSCRWMLDGIDQGPC